jgi:hypothetical protein
VREVVQSMRTHWSLLMCIKLLDIEVHKGIAAAEDVIGFLRLNSFLVWNKIRLISADGLKNLLLNFFSTWTSARNSYAF